MLIPRSIVPLAKICDRETSRYALGGVKLIRQQDGQPLAIACDGRRLVIERWAEPTADQYRTLAHPTDAATLVHVPGYDAIIAAKDFEAANKLPAPKGKFAASEKGHTLAHLAVCEPGTNGHVTISAHDGGRSGQHTAATLEGRYPRWQDVVPDYGGDYGISINLNARLLAEMLTAISAHAGNENDSVTLTLAADDAFAKPIVISAARADGNAAYGVMMPLHRDRHDKPGPVWQPSREVPAERAIEKPAAKPEPKVSEPATPPAAESSSPAEQPKPATPARQRTTRPKTAKPAPAPAPQPEPETVAAASSPASPSPPDWRDTARRCGY